jgi:alpha-glucuronidase
MVARSVDVPSPTPRTFGRHYKEIAPWVFGAYCSNNSPRFLYSALNYYVFYKVAWNNATDVDALVDEYNRLMFGPAAEPM